LGAPQSAARKPEELLLERRLLLSWRYANLLALYSNFS